MASGLSSRAGMIFWRAVRVAFIDDPALKLVCLVLATGLWFYIDGEINKTKSRELRSSRPAVVTTQLTIQAHVPPGRALRIEPANLPVEVFIDERDCSEQEALARVSLYVEWPGQWAEPAENAELGPIPVEVKFNAPPHVIVRGINNTSLPTVNVTGTRAGGLK